MSTTVGEPVPRHSRYIWRPPPMSTKPEKSPSRWALAVSCVVSLDWDDVEVSELVPVHPAATSARAKAVASARRFKRLLPIRQIACCSLWSSEGRIDTYLSTRQI